MSPVSKLSVLAFASTVLASPYAAHGHGHAHAHRHLHTGSGAPYSYGANSTGVYAPTGSPKAPSYASPSSVSGYETMTDHSTRTSTIFQTVYQTLQGSAAASSVQAAAAGASDVCGTDVTVTSTEKVYVTVTAGGVSSSSAPAAVPYGSSSSIASAAQSSSAPVSAASAPGYSAPAYSAASSVSTSEAAPVSTSSSSASAPAYSAPSSVSTSEAAPVSTSSSSASAPAYSAPSSESSSVAAPVTTSSSAAPAYTPAATSSSSSSVLAILPSTYSVADKGAGASATASAPASYSSAASSGGKRGLAYNDASLTQCFSGSSQVSWAYNWISSSDGLTGYNYIPTLHSNVADFTNSWSSDAQNAINSGSTTLFSFNEPDIASQANLDVGTAVSQHKQYMSQFKSKAKVCAPSVSNSGTPGQGLDYLQKFLDQCNGTDCPVDCLNIHWYASCNSTDFINHAKTAVDMLKDEQTLYVSEFGATDGSDEEISSFLQDVMAYMDGESKIAGYAYFMVENGKLVSGSEPSTYGNVYKTYAS